MPSLRKTPAELGLGAAQPLLWEAFQGEESQEGVLSRSGSVILNQWAGAPLLEGPMPSLLGLQGSPPQEGALLGTECARMSHREREKQLLWFGGRLASCHRELR